MELDKSHNFSLSQKARNTCYKDWKSVTRKMEKCSLRPDSTDEEITKHEEYCGKRVKRGLFRTKDGRMVNADLNGSLNIMKKALSEVSEWNSELFRQCVEQNSAASITRYRIALS